MATQAVNIIVDMATSETQKLFESSDDGETVTYVGEQPITCAIKFDGRIMHIREIQPLEPALKVFNTPPENNNKSDWYNVMTSRYTHPVI